MVWYSLNYRNMVWYSLNYRIRLADLLSGRPEGIFKACPGCGAEVPDGPEVGAKWCDKCRLRLGLPSAGEWISPPPPLTPAPPDG